MINNEVKENGIVVGYRCSDCDEVKTKMWEIFCNLCRRKRAEDKHIIPTCEICGTFLGNSSVATCACGKYSW